MTEAGRPTEPGAAEPGPTEPGAAVGVLAADRSAATTDAARPATDPDGHPRPRGRRRAAVGWTASVLAFLLVWFALVAPDRLGQLTPLALLRIPVEGLLLVAAVLVLPRRPATIASLIAGALLGILTVVKVLDLGFRAALDRPFDLVSDWGYLGPGIGVLRDSIGDGAGIAVAVTAALLAVALLVAVPLSLLRLAGLAARHRTASARAVAGLAAGWLVCLLLGAQLVPGVPVASTATAALAADHARAIVNGVEDQQTFSAQVSDDPADKIPADRLLTALRGKDVLIAFVESYGRVALQSPVASPPVVAALDAGETELRSAGFAARSAFLTSPTFGGISWLAHSTLQSGLWVDNQSRYNTVVSTDRFTLSDAFARAGWRTVGVVPSNEQNWTQGASFYGYDKLYDARNVGYRGPEFGYSTMPDQYTLSALQRRELAAPDRRAVMAEIDLTSSHSPWAPLPSVVSWDAVRDGSVFDPMPAQGLSARTVWKDSRQVQIQYGHSVAYSVFSLLSFVRTYGDDDLVLVMLGDHQPATVVSGEGASHDVPITIVARDPAVLDHIADWGWQDGVRPGAVAPVWPMNSFRDRFLAAFGS